MQLNSYTPVDSFVTQLIREDSLTKHPETHLLDVVCATCGTAFAIRSTASSVSVDVCSKCHPAYTDRPQNTASGSRTERFNRRRALAAA
jgi:large subunit ribosomal protein L31